MTLPADFLPTLVNALAPLVLAVLVLLLGTLTRYVQQRTAHMKNQYLAGVLVRLDDAVETAVRETAQTLVEDMRRAAGDGKITPEEALEARDRALGKLKEYVGDKGAAELGRVLGLGPEQVQKYLVGKLEAKVHELKGLRGVELVTSTAPAGEPVVPGGAP